VHVVGNEKKRVLQYVISKGSSSMCVVTYKVLQLSTPMSTSYCMPVVCAGLLTLRVQGVGEKYLEMKQSTQNEIHLLK
jgi:hypothetical protein